MQECWNPENFYFSSKFPMFLSKPLFCFFFFSVYFVYDWAKNILVVRPSQPVMH